MVWINAEASFSPEFLLHSHKMASPRRISNAESSACTGVVVPSSSTPLTVTFAPIETTSPSRAAATAAAAAACTTAAAASTSRVPSDRTPGSPSTPSHLLREQILPRPLFLPPRDQAPLASVLSRTRTLSSVSGDDHGGSHRRSDAAAATRRNRLRRNSTRSRSSRRLGGCSTITATVPMTRRRSAASSLERRRRYYQCETEITEERLSRRFPTRTVVALSALHLIVCVIVLFVQFWTSSRVAAHNMGADFTALNWAKSVNTYGYMSALLAGLAGCAGIAVYLRQSKVRAIWFLSMSVSAVLIACYLLTFYTSYFAEIRFFVSAQGCIEKYDKDPNFKLPFALMTVLMLLEFFFASISIVVLGTVINRARACWWSCDPCAICQLDEDLEITLEEAEEGAVDDYVGVASSPRLAFEMPPSYLDRPPPYKP